MKQLASWEVLEQWDKLHAVLQSCGELLNGDAIVEDLLQGIEEGQVQVFRNDDPEIVAVTEIVQYPRRRVVRILLLAGSGLKLLDEALFIAWARGVGATEIEAHCNESRERLFMRHGFERRNVILRRKI